MLFGCIVYQTLPTARFQQTFQRKIKALMVRMLLPFKSPKTQGKFILQTFFIFPLYSFEPQVIHTNNLPVNQTFAVYNLLAFWDNFNIRRKNQLSLPRYFHTLFTQSYSYCICQIYNPVPDIMKHLTYIKFK